MSSQVIFNGTLVDESAASISINNRSFRYGDGCFETIKVINGKIILLNLHLSRLFTSLEMLQYSKPDYLNADHLSGLIIKLISLNNHSSLARVRITMFRGDGGVYDDINHEPNFIIQSWSASQEALLFNKQGFSLNIYREAKKTFDRFSSIKSNNFLPYIMGALYAQKNMLDDCLVINSHDRIAESTIANLFILIDGVIKTPALTEGCINGVMRKFLISSFKKENLPFLEGEVTMEELLAASEVFLTNAIYGIRWVANVGNTNYTNQMSAFLHQKYIEPLFNSATI